MSLNNISFDDAEQAVEKCNTSLIRQYVKEGGNLRETNVNGETLLHIAAKSSIPEIIEELVQGGLGVNVTDSSGNTPLIAACENGQLKNVVALLKHKADVNLLGKTKGPLHVAVEKGEKEIVEHLLNKNSLEVNKQQKDNGNTALHIASFKGNKAIAKLLMTRGARSDVTNFQNQFATDVAKNEEMKMILKSDVKIIQGEPEQAQFNGHRFANVDSKKIDASSTILSAHPVTDSNIEIRIQILEEKVSKINATLSIDNKTNVSRTDNSHYQTKTFANKNTNFVEKQLNDLIDELKRDFKLQEDRLTRRIIELNDELNKCKQNLQEQQDQLCRAYKDDIETLRG